MNKENLKSKIKSRMSELGADLSKFKFRYFNVLTNESFENKEYSDEYLCMIIAEQKTK
jgi:hypothetical protein